ncbi:MAG: RecX family transcriptional regulator [Candidatus Amulumruptor caecigallinarius]|nr:RecX family transcriptional regulator [Candidatus Amulumruptor caecigallinarius]MCM1397783.1 RecX family transcriptional regulator [Candidatus Amulumruptor caecigallinarius]MCM1454822.1 RecX family transcriptional regulator [bacterium]
MRGATRPVPPSEALARLESLCASAERCTWEVRAKLRRWSVSADEAERIIESLQKRHFLNDERFARAFVRDRLRFARWGKLKIRAALYAKHVPLWMVDEAMTEIDDDEYLGALITVLTARARAMGEEARTYDGRTRLFRYAASRGYELSLIASTIRNPAFWASLPCP